MFNDDINPVWAFAVFVVLFMAFVSLVGMTDEATAARVLVNEGMTSVQFTGYDFGACGHDDWYATGFRGVRNGHAVTGTVCSGLILKGSTVRYH